MCAGGGGSATPAGGGSAVPGRVWPGTSGEAGGGRGSRGAGYHHGDSTGQVSRANMDPLKCLLEMSCCCIHASERLTVFKGLFKSNLNLIFFKFEISVLFQYVKDTAFKL